MGAFGLAAKVRDSCLSMRKDTLGNFWSFLRGGLQAPFFGWAEALVLWSPWDGFF